MTTAGINVNSLGHVEGFGVTAEQCDFPPANAKVGGTQPTSIVPYMPGLVIAGIVSVPLGGFDPSVYRTGIEVAPIEIRVVTNAPLTSDEGTVDLKRAYEQLRQRMSDEGLPFLNGAELDKEIADNKGTRS